MFAYCNNNPVMYRDDSGNAPSHVMVALYDGGGSTSYNDIRASRYLSSIGGVLVFDGREISKSEMANQAMKYPDCIIVYDARYCSDGCDGTCNPNMQIYNTWRISFCCLASVI